MVVVARLRLLESSNNLISSVKQIQKFSLVLDKSLVFKAKLLININLLIEELCKLLFGLQLFVLSSTKVLEALTDGFIHFEFGKYKHKVIKRQSLRLCLIYI